MPVIEPKDGEPLEIGRVYLAPRDVHMTIEDDRCGRSYPPARG
jgi:chemotaxis response regulator CheB